MSKVFFTNFDSFCIFIGIIEYLCFVICIYSDVKAMVLTISLLIYNLLYEVRTRWKIIITSLLSAIIGWKIYVLTKDVFIVDIAQNYIVLKDWPLGFEIYGVLTLWNYIPLLIGLYYFYYRFQRNVSESYMINFYFKPERLMFTETIIVLSILVGKIEGKLSLCDVILLIFFVIWMLGFVGHVFHRLKINFFLIDSMEYLDGEIKILNFYYHHRFTGSFLKRHIYKDINNRVEIIYQILEYIIRKNTNVIYNKYASKIMELFIQLKSFIGLEYAGKKIIVKNLDDIFVNTYNKVDYELYDVFKNMLRFHKKICILLYEQYRNGDYDEAWKFLVNIYPIKLQWDPANEAVQRIINEIYKTYWSLAVFFLSRDRDKFQDVIVDVNKLSLENPGIIKNIVVYRALLITTVELDNLGILTEICYLQKKYIDDIGGRRYCGKKSKDKREYYNGMMLYVLIQTAVKTIELSQYNITGFLTKYIVSNYESDMLADVCMKIVENNIIYDYELKRESLYDRLGVNFKINADTAFYFLKKFLILLIIQYRCRFDDGKCNDIENVFAKACAMYCSENKRFDDAYCIEKIMSARKEYGMLALDKFYEKWEDITHKEQYEFVK